MTLADFFTAVNAAGVRISNVAGQLRLQGPSQVVQELREAAAEHKAAILAVLPDEAEQASNGDAMDPGAHGATPAARSAAEGFRHDHDWRDWRLEWVLEVGILALRIQDCQDGEVCARLQELARERPASEADWLALGGRIRSAERGLAEEGKLPGYYFPE
jgi:hypothetical protein